MALIDSYGRLVYDLETLIAQGLSAAVYTQTTDVEGEVNGLITYCLLYTSGSRTRPESAVRIGSRFHGCIPF